MAIDTHNTPEASRQNHQPAPTSGGRGGVRAFFAGLARALGRLFNRSQPETKPTLAVPVVHQEVTLTPEGVEVWNQAMAGRPL
jgi:hypothetical protein